MTEKIYSFLKARLLIIIFIFCTAAVCAAIIKYYSHKIVFTQADKFKDINIESFMDTGDKYDIAVFYPSTPSKRINAKVKSLTDSYINTLKYDAMYFVPKNSDEKFSLLIEYETEKVSDDIVSFIFIINYTQGDKCLNSEAVTQTYNMRTGREIKLSTFFNTKSDYEDFLLSKAQETLIKDKSVPQDVATALTEEINKSGIDSFSGIAYTYDTLNIYMSPHRLNNEYSMVYCISLPWEMLMKYLNKNIILPDYYADMGAAETSVEYTEPSGNQYFPAFNVNIDSTDKVVALTFDDGPHNVYTDKILRHLGEKKIVATFFVLGNRVEYNKELLKRMVDLGCEIGNHSLSHKQLTKLTNSEVQKQIETVNQSIKEITGYDIRAVRPPYGSSNATVKKIINKPIVLWSVDPEDWKHRDAVYVRDHVLSKVKDGSIVLMHDIYESSADAAIMIIDELLAQGYKFVTVSQMLGLEDAATNGIVFTHKTDRSL